MFANDRSNQPVIILSAFRADQSENGNLQRHAHLCNALANQGIAYKECDGYFEGAREKSVAVPLPHQNERLIARMMFALAFDTFDQDSVLWLSPRDAKGRHAFLIDNKTGRRMIWNSGAFRLSHGEHLGYWKRVPRPEAERYDAHTIDVNDPAHAYIVQ